MASGKLSTDGFAGEDLRGQRFGRLTVIAFDHYEDRMWRNRTCRTKIWRCTCRCDGRDVLVRHNNLKSGNSTSCGCYNTEVHRRIHFKHGYTGNDGRHHPLYRCWCDMWTRCTNEKYRLYADYGGRGIKVTEPAWETFAGFLADMGKSWKNGLTIERIDVNGPYCKSNTTWIPRFAQGSNKRSNVRITHNGETLTIAEWVRRTGLPRMTLYKRIWNGWPHSLAITTPAGVRNGFKPKPLPSLPALPM